METMGFEKAGTRGGWTRSAALLPASEIKELALKAGAADAGLVDIDRPGLAAQQQDILRVFSATKSLLGFVVALSPENVRCVSRAVSDNEYRQAMEEASAVGRRVVLALAERGVAALSPSAGFPMETARWPGKMWEVAHKPVAVEAGLGHLGLSRLLLHPRYGAFVVLGTVLLAAATDSYDRPLKDNPCIDCKLCAAVCPVGAIHQGGYFQFSNCMTHNYRDRMGGFLDWVESLASSKNARHYRRRVSPPRTVSMWQSLSYGICNKSSYCMAACPAGELWLPEYEADKKAYLARVVRPLQEANEEIYVIAGSDAEAHVKRRFAHKTAVVVHNGLRPNSAAGFLRSLDLVFQRGPAQGLQATYHFSFRGAEELSATVKIGDQHLAVETGLSGSPDLTVKADSQTWVRFLCGEANLLWALLRGKISLKGPPRLLKAFAACFPS